MAKPLPKRDLHRHKHISLTLHGKVRERKHGITKTIPCAITSDYLPVIESYGAYFEPIAKVRHDKTYCNTQEYQLRLKNYQSNRIF